MPNNLKLDVEVVATFPNGDVLNFRNLRIIIDCEKRGYSSQAIGTGFATSIIKIYGLSRESQNRLYKEEGSYKYYKDEETIDGSYNDTYCVKILVNKEIIFFGKVWSCRSTRQGADVVTEIDITAPFLTGSSAAASECGVKKQHISKTVPAGNDIYAAILSESNKEIIINEPLIFETDTVLFGSINHLLQKYQGQKTMISNNANQVVIELIKNNYGKESIELTSDYILEIPIIKNQIHAEFKIRYRNDIEVGDIIDVKSTFPQTSGIFKVWGITHNIDTYGQSTKDIQGVKI